MAEEAAAVSSESAAPAAEAPAAVEPSTAPQAPAPAAPAAPEAVAPKAPAEEAPSAPKSVGNAELDSVVTVLSKAGVKSGEQALRELAENGSISLDLKAQMMSEGDPAIVGMAISQAESVVANAKTEAKAIGDSIKSYAAEKFGGEAEETWGQIGQFFNSEHFTDAERETLKGLMKNPESGRIAINEIKSRYDQRAGVSQPADLIQGTTSTVNSFEPLGKVDYVNEMREAVSKYGENSQQVAALRNRRNVSKQRGF